MAYNLFVPRACPKSGPLITIGALPLVLTTGPRESCGDFTKYTVWGFKQSYTCECCKSKKMVFLTTMMKTHILPYPSGQWASLHVSLLSHLDDKAKASWDNVRTLQALSSLGMRDIGKRKIRCTMSQLCLGKTWGKTCKKSTKQNKQVKKWVSFKVKPHMFLDQWFVNGNNFHEEVQTGGLHWSEIRFHLRQTKWRPAPVKSLRNIVRSPKSSFIQTTSSGCFLFSCSSMFLLCSQESQMRSMSQ